MLHHFEIETKIKYQGREFDGAISGTLTAIDYMYGEDRDGNRGERRTEIEIAETYEIVIDIGHDSEKMIFLKESDVENWSEIMKDILKKVDFD